MKQNNKHITQLVAAGIVFAITWSVAYAPHAAAVTTGLCGDRYTGFASKCPTAPPAGTKIDGKTGGTFSKNKCYISESATSGWTTADCSDDIFKNIVGTAPIQPKADPASTKDCSKTSCDLIETLINPIINFLAAAVGIVITISIIIGGIQYSASADDPKAVSEAKTRIINAVLALLGFLFLWAFLQWLLPGGILNNGVRT